MRCRQDRASSQYPSVQCCSAIPAVTSGREWVLGRVGRDVAIPTPRGPGCADFPLPVPLPRGSLKGSAAVGHAEWSVAKRRVPPYGQNIGTAEEPVLHRAVELAGAQSWGDG